MLFYLDKFSFKGLNLRTVCMAFSINPSGGLNCIGYVVTMGNDCE